MATKFIVTITPPTPNGDLHLGHLSGPFLAADVMQRALRQRGHDVLFVSYSDDYQSYLPRKTNALLRKPFDYGRLMRRAMQLSLELADIHLDCFMQAAHNPAYKQAGEHYASLLAPNISLLRSKTFYCSQCEVYGYEGFGRTHCNWCGTSSDASQCEHCAKVPSSAHIDHMTCTSCQESMQIREIDQHVWHIGRHYQDVARALESRPKRSCLKAFLGEVLANTDEHWHISRPHDAGLNLAALQGFPAHTWFLGLSGYRASVQTLLQKRPELGRFEEWWSTDTELVHFLGFDCSYSHAVGYSAQLLADPCGPLPGTLITNRFLKLDGEDFSTSRGHAVWIKDLTGLYPADALRLFCALHAPETQVVNFDRQAFEQWYRHVFAQLAQLPESLPEQTAQEAKLHRAQLVGTAEWQEWQRSSSLESFSMANMARSFIAFATWVRNSAHFAHSEVAWHLVVELAAPLCPTLSQSLQSALTACATHRELANELV